MTKDHGYVFEVDPYDRRANRDPKPLKAFGRYDHEAVVIDPKRGHAYLTEDAAGPNGLLYRWAPPQGFRTAAASSAPSPTTRACCRPPSAIDSGGRFVDDLSRATKIGTVYGVDWVDVPDRDARTVAGAQAVRRRRGHPRPQAGGHVVGRRRRVHRLLLRP